MNLTASTWMIALPLLSSPVVYLAGHVGGLRPALARWVALLAMLLAWIPFAMAAMQFAATGPQVFNYGAVALRMDGLSLLLAAVALGLGTLVTLYSIPYMAGEQGEEKYYAMLVIMIGAMIGLGSAADLFNLWVWFETMAISSYVLVAFYREQPASLEAGVKYLVQSAAGSVLVLVGIALVLASTGTLDLTAIHAAGLTSNLLLAAAALMVIGFGVKAALVPMHTWLPDAHSQAPSGISAMLSGVVIEAGLVAMLRAVFALAGVTPSWGALLMGFGCLNMLVGNLLALRQTQVKRLLAFSSLSHVGYMLVGLGIAAYAGQAASASGAFFHLINHATMKGLAFLAAGVLLYTLHIARGDHGALTTKDLAGGAQRYPFVAFAFSVAVLALGGLPPLAGFMSKWQIFVGGFATGNTAIYAVVIFAVANSVLSLGYYAPLVNALYRHEQSDAVKAGAPAPLLLYVPLVVLAAFVIVLGVWPSLATGLTDPAGAVFMAAFGGK